MTNEELQQLLADNIITRYSPLAFMCSCKGMDWSCEMAMNDPYTAGVMDTVRRIAEYVREFYPEN